MKPQRIVLAVIGCIGCVAILASPSNGAVVNPGNDLFKTSPGATQEFGTGGVDSAPAIPADFFDPGSDPFTGTVNLMSNPLGTFGGFGVGSADTIVRRLVTANVPNMGDSDTIPIEIVALSLTSVSPITVTFNGGQNPELWDVDVTLSPSTPSPGTMTINHSAPEGGTYDADMNVFVLFTFTRQSDSSVRLLDSGTIPYNANVTTSNSPNWEHEPTNGQSVVLGLTGDESNLAGAPWTNDFYIFGIIEHTGPHPVAPGTGGACCDKNGCNFNTEDGCLQDPNLNGTFLGIGTFCLGDGNGNSLSDTCDGACCTADGACTVTSELICRKQPVTGTFLGFGTACLGDNDGNGVDDRCESNVPAVSEWGVGLMVLLLLLVATLAIRGRRRRTSVV